MAQKKQKKQTAQHISPERFIREKARSFPIYKCYISPDWKESGIGWIFVTRRRKSGNLIVGVFLVDFYCMGVKDGIYSDNMTEEEMQERFFDNMPVEFKEITYPEVHNMILGAAEFAGEADIPQCKEYSILQYILEPDTDDIPLIEYEYGKNGKYLLVCGPDSTDKYLIPGLQKRLGEKFEYILPEINDEIINNPNIHCDLPEEPYSYVHPDYPTEYTRADQRVIEMLESFADPFYPTEAEIKAILDLPTEILTESLTDIVYTQLGKLYMQYADFDDIDDDFTILSNAALLLGEIPSREGARAILETLTLPSDLLDIVYGDILTEYMPSLIARLAPVATDDIVEYMEVKGITDFARSAMSHGLLIAAGLNPGLRPDIVKILGRHIEDMHTRIPALEAADGIYGGLLISSVFVCGIHELYDTAERLFDTGLTDPSIMNRSDFERIRLNLDDENDEYERSLSEFFERMRNW